MEKIGKALLGIAPVLANALIPGVGGAVAGAAINAVGSALGMEPDAKGEINQKELLKKVNTATPEQLALIKKAELDFEVKMKEMDVDLEELKVRNTENYLKDRANARLMQIKTNSSAPSVLGYFVVAAGFTIMGGTVYKILTDGRLDTSLSVEMALLLGTIIGYVAGEVKSVTQYFFGSSQGGDKASEKLGDNFTKAIEKKGNK